MIKIKCEYNHTKNESYPNLMKQLLQKVSQNNYSDFKTFYTKIIFPASKILFFLTFNKNLNKNETTLSNFKRKK